MALIQWELWELIVIFLDPWSQQQDVKFEVLMVLNKKIYGLP
jgi:hypothetical protein